MNDSIRRIAVLVFVLLAALPFEPIGLLAQEPAATAPPPPPGTVVRELMVEVVDGDGEPPRSLSPADLEVVEGSVGLPVLDVAVPSPGAPPAPVGGPWRLTIYLDSLLAGDRSVGRAGRVLEERAAALAALGWVEVVAADPEPRLILPATRDPQQVAAALGRVFLLERGQDRLIALRRDAQAAIAAAPAGAGREAALASAVAAETALVRERQDALLGWLTDRAAGPGAGAAGPRALLLVTDGFDLDPAAALRERLVVADEVRGALPPPGDPDLLAPTEDLAQALAATGWVTLPLLFDLGGGEGPSRWGVAYDEDLQGKAKVQARVTLPRRKTAAERAEEQVEAERRAQEPPPVLARDPLAAVGVLATATGGEVVTDPPQLAGALNRLAGRARVRYAGGLNLEGAPVPLAVRALRSGLTARAPLWAPEANPEAVAALRARRLLAGDLLEGELAVTAAVELTEGASPARIEARVAAVSAAPEPAAAGRRPSERGAPSGLTAAGAPSRVSAALPRVTVAAVAAGEGGEVVVARRVEAAPTTPAPAGGVDDGWRLALTAELPARTERVALVVEDLRSGRWGGTLAALVHREPAAAGAEDARDAAESGREGEAGANRFDADRGLLPAPRVVNLLQPESRMLLGEVAFETVVSDPAVARVEFRLDGRRAATAERAPFRAALDLGRLPLRRRVEAVAYDAGGRVLGRDSIVVNEGGRSFAVHITEPLAERRVGPVDVTAEVTHPEGDRVARVEFYWNDERVATLFQPPWRYRLFVPAAAPEGFVRVTATLADGTSAEDVRILNAAAGGRVDVNLVELYAVVDDADGRPVKGLGADDFTLTVNGAPQRLASVSDAGDQPVTVGLAIDSSASMFVKLPAVQAAATRFLAGLVPGRDQAFAVDFADRPRLAAEPTRDLDRVAAAVNRLQAGGQTSFWESVVYSLVQLQGMRGRKALVVYSDGADEDKDFNYRTALRFARKVGIPIYVIVSNNEAVRTDWLGIRSFGDRVERLTGAVGGRSYLVRSGADLTAIYDEIERELRSQYLLTFYAQRVEGSEAWREVKVEVERRGLTARTLSGYQF